MSTQVADSVNDLLDDRIDVNEPLEWEFLGNATCPPWDRSAAYRAGDCVSLPDGAIFSARRSVHPGEVGPGERGWENAWTPGTSAVLGADPAAEAAHRERYHGRGTRVGALVADYTSLQGEADPVLTTQRIIERARDAKAPSLPPAAVVSYDDADDEIDLAPVREEILGEIDLAPVREEILGTEGLPLTTALYRRFEQRDPKYVRLDTEIGYRDFRAERSPEIAELHAKVAALDALCRAHAKDGHGAENILLGLASDVSHLQSAQAENRVPLRVPPWMEGTWDCWREEGPEGGLVCSSLALPGHDGQARICTSAVPVRKHVEDVVTYTRDVGGDVVTLLGVLPTVACMLAGGNLLSEMAAAAPKILAHPQARGDRAFVGKILPANRPTLATLAALLQTAQAGDLQAAREWTALARVAESRPDLAEAMTEAKRRLASAQEGPILGRGGVGGWSRR